MTNGQPPLTGHFSMGYDRAALGRVELLPFEFTDQTGAFKFSGFTLNASGSGSARSSKPTVYWAASTSPQLPKKALCT